MAKAIGKALGGILPAAAGVAGSMFGGPLGGAAASTAAGMLTGKLLGQDEAMSAQGTAADAKIYALPKLAGYTNNMGIPEVDVPVYGGGPILPYSMPTVPKPILAPPTQGEMGQGQALATSKAALMSMLEPTSPAMKDLTNAESQLGRIDFLKGLKDVMTANRRSQAQGRGGLFQNERQDETLSRMIQQNAQSSDAAARSRAMDRLGSFANNMQTIAGGYGNYANTTRTRQQDFISQLNNYIGQQRQDMATRNSQMRSDAATKSDQQRENATNFINTLNRTSPAIAAANQNNRAVNYENKVAMAQPLINAAGSAISKLFSGGGGSGGSMYASNPWLNPDTGTYVY